MALMEIYIEGASTRKVKEVTEELCGTSFSKSLLSSLAGSLDSELSAWRNRPLEWGRKVSVVGFDEEGTVQVIPEDRTRNSQSVDLKG